MTLYRRESYYMICVPDYICEATITINRVGLDDSGKVIGTTPITTFSPITDDTRPTFCDQCETDSRIVLPVHRNLLSTIGLYQMCIEYKCCEGREDNVIGAGSTCFYYEFVNAASDVDVEIAFTASQQIENINGDPDVDGIITTDGSFPGPELGPASAGVRVSAVGNGIEDYTVEVYEVDCDNPNGSGTLINSETIPYNGDQEVFYSFLNIPNWENIYSTDACYKVITIVNSICDIYKEEAYFTISDQCTFCLIGPSSGGNASNQVSTHVQVEKLSAGEVSIESEKNIRTVILLDQYGRILTKKEIKEQKNCYVDINELNIGSSYILVVIIAEDGTVHKSMIPNMR